MTEEPEYDELVESLQWLVTLRPYPTAEAWALAEALVERCAKAEA